MKLSGNPRTQDSYVPTGRIWPSGDFSVGFRRVAGDQDARLDLRSEERRIDDGEYVGLPGDWEYLGRGRTAVMPGALSASEKAECNAAHGGDSPLTLANVRNSHTAFWAGHRPVVALALAGWLALSLTRFSAPQRGLKGITGYGKNVIKSACTLIAGKHSNRRTTFCTVTMPEMPMHLRKELARCWPEYCRQLLQWLSRRLERQGLVPAIASVTEIQPNRLEETGEAYLHLHLVWGNKMARAGHWAVSANEIRAWSEDFLKRRGLFPDHSFVRCNVQPIRKSAAGYMAKYMSKGVSELAAMAEDLGWEAIPSQWWNMTKAARDWVKAELAHGDDVGAVLLATVDAIFSKSVPFQDVMFSLHEVMLEWDGHSVGVGWRGALRPGYRNELLQMLDSPVPMLAS